MLAKESMCCYDIKMKEKLMAILSHGIKVCSYMESTSVSLTRQSSCLDSGVN